MSQADHAPLPPSAASRWVPCGRSATLEPLFPDDPDDEAAREGTAAHWLLSESLNGVVDITPGTLDPHGYPVTQEMVDAVGPLVADILATVPEGHRHNLKVEQRVSMAREIHPDNWGTPDAYWVDTMTRTIHLWDFKFGHGYVDAFQNWQLVDYGQGVWEGMDINHREFSFRFTIYQPRNYHKDGPLRRWECSGDRHAQLVAQLREAATRAVDPESPAVTGDHCRHCKGRHACEALQRASMSAVDVAYRTAPLVLPPGAAGLELRVIDEAMARLKARREGLEAQVASLVRSGQQGTGWTLEQGYGREKWTQPVEDVIALGALYGKDLAAPVAAITPPQARKLGIDDDVIAAYSEKPKGEMKLVPVTDRDAQRVFN